MTRHPYCTTHNVVDCVWWAKGVSHWVYRFVIFKGQFSPTYAIRSIQINPVLTLTLWNSGGSIPLGMVRMNTWAGDFFSIFVCSLVWIHKRKRGAIIIKSKIFTCGSPTQGEYKIFNPCHQQISTLSKVSSGMKTMWDFDRRQKMVGSFCGEPSRRRQGS